MTDAITLLQAAPGFFTAKTFTPSGVRQYSAGTLFVATEVEVDSLLDIAEIVTEASDPELGMLVIRGVLRPGIEQPVLRRSSGPDACFTDRPHYWIMIDLDKVAVDGSNVVLYPEDSIRAAIELYLPEYFRTAACFWQLSSSAGLKNDGTVSVHLWFWLNRPLSSDEATDWARSCAPDVDEVVFRTVQPHFIATPRFEGVSDPLERRFGWLEGTPAVDFPRDWESPERRQRASWRAADGELSAGRTYEDRMSELGDHEGGGGFHSVILGGIWAYLARGGSDLQWLKTDIRRRIGLAHAGPDREADLERYASDRYLDDSIAGAQRKLDSRQLRKFTRDAVQQYGKSLKRKSDDRVAEVGIALVRMCNGEPFAEPGDEAHISTRVVAALADRYPDHDPLSLPPLLAPSAQIMKLSIEPLVIMLRSEQAERRRKRLRHEEQRAERIREAFQNGRDYGYTDDELEALGPRPFWIVQYGRSFYLLFNGSYRGPYTPEDVLQAVVRELAPAWRRVELYRRNLRTGELIQKTAGELVREYGTVADQVVVDLSAQVTTYDESTRTIIEASCRLIVRTPRYHEEIAVWLRLLSVTEELHEKLLTWLARCTYLDRISPALFVTGPTGIGKSLFGEALSTLYTDTGPTPLEHVFGDFNDQLARCPICFADEKLPEDHRGISKNAELRLHIQQRTRLYKRKFFPNAKMRGATRTVVVANNEDVLATRENLTASDVQAIVGRYLHIDVPINYGQQVVRKYLDELNEKEPGRIRRWIEEGWFAEHVLWLRDNHRWIDRGRYGIEINDERLQRSLLTRTGTPSAVCQWLVGYLLDPKKFDNDGRSDLLVRKKNGNLLVNTQGMIRCWNLYVTNEDCPKTGQLSIALSGLCDDDGKADGRLRYQDHRGRWVKYRVINVDNLIRWALDKGFADEEEIREALLEDTPERRTVATAN